MIETARLVLRPPESRDYEALFAVNGDPRVGAWLGGTQAREQSDAMLERNREHLAAHGFGFWAIERKSDRAVVGLAGLLDMPDGFGPGPAIEAAWRLAPDAWGHGYATEAARAALDWGFAELQPPEIIAITAKMNLRSQAVMTRLGMRHEPARDFLHPRLAEDHPLRPHVTFSIRR
ncbi:MAG: GNAT family N-acetyltransferase [Alphaproteobacteria bacterium]|nr:GNAT family N-acetyltransferase [Alphaproteobacteria bacterium]